MDQNKKLLIYLRACKKSKIFMRIVSALDCIF